MVDKIQMIYDIMGDVLYISLGNPVPCYSKSIGNVVLLRRSQENNIPCAVTVIGYFANEWDNKLSELNKIVTEYIGVGEEELDDLMNI